LKDTRDCIISAARHLFAQQGFHGTSVDSIAKKAGVSKGALYWHFSDKFELYRTVLVLEIERMKDIFKSTFEDATDVKEFVRRRGMLILMAFEKDPETMLIWMDLLIQAKRGKEEFKNMAKDLASCIKKSMDEGVCIDLAEDGQESVFLLLRLVVFGLLSCQGSVLDTGEAIDCWKQIVDLVMKGVE
jgi:AcrR family transcriptional regulator